MRIYLDNCCFNRPFDDQRQARVRLEAEAKLCIQQQIREGTLELAWSYILDLENSANPFEERRATIQRWKQLAVVDIEESGALLERARDLVASGLRPKDALHVACAIAGRSVRFVTTDDEILKMGRRTPEIHILDPTTFIREAGL